MVKNALHTLEKCIVTARKLQNEDKSGLTLESA